VARWRELAGFSYEDFRRSDELCQIPKVRSPLSMIARAQMLFASFNNFVINGCLDDLVAARYGWQPDKKTLATCHDRRTNAE
jgi:hypothetical protein